MWVRDPDGSVAGLGGARPADVNEERGVMGDHPFQRKWVLIKDEDMIRPGLDTEFRSASCLFKEVNIKQSANKTLFDLQKSCQTQDFYLPEAAHRALAQDLDFWSMLALAI